MLHFWSTFVESYTHISIPEWIVFILIGLVTISVLLTSTLVYSTAHASNRNWIIMTSRGPEPSTSQSHSDLNQRMSRHQEADIVDQFGLDSGSEEEDLDPPSGKQPLLLSKVLLDKKGKVVKKTANLHDISVKVDQLVTLVSGLVGTIETLRLTLVEQSASISRLERALPTLQSSTANTGLKFAPLKIDPAP